jgi:adenine-specific DNA methylase
MQQSFCKETPVWKVVLVQESTIQNGHLRALVRELEPGDPVDTGVASEDYPELNARIDDGIETRRLLRAGFRVWGDLYTTRQVRVLLESLRHIRGMDVSDGCRDRLALAVIGAAEMAAFLSRWDRYHLKAYEGLANHRYAHTTMTVETNMLGLLGRGTLFNRLRAAVRAIEWTSSNLPRGGVGMQVVSLSSQVDFETDVLIAMGDSSHQALASRSVDVVLTDPPYFDDVQYGELARLFHYWLGHYREIPEAEEGKEAVPNLRRGNGAKFYETVITDCLRESERTLREGGKLILTYHNRKIQAWRSLACALVESGFIIRAAAVARAENSADITKRDGRGILYDLVLECERRSESAGRTITFVAGESGEEREILAMGIALGEAVRRAEPERLLNLYQSQLLRFGISGRYITCGGMRSVSRQSRQVP